VLLVSTNILPALKIPQGLFQKPMRLLRHRQRRMPYELAVLRHHPITKTLSRSQEIAGLSLLQAGAYAGMPSRSRARKRPVQRCHGKCGRGKRGASMRSTRAFLRIFRAFARFLAFAESP